MTGASGPGDGATAAAVAGRRRGGYLLSTEPALVDVARVHAWLSEDSYWARGRDLSTVERALRGSRPYVVIDQAADRAQVAFARVVTDDATFAWICDVFVDPAHRGRGVGQWVISSVLDDLSAAGVRRVLLKTRDAHALYAQSGFAPLAAPRQWMELELSPSGAGAATVAP
jgi:GNAT superfamily N-acetyltransferase